MHLSYVKKMSSSQKILIRDLEDLVTRVALELPDKNDIEEATKQLRKLKAKEHTHPVKDDAFSAVSKIVERAEKYGITGWRSAKDEFTKLIEIQNSNPEKNKKESTQQSPSQNLSKTMPAKVPRKEESGTSQKRSNSPSRADKTISVSLLEYNRLVESEKMNKAKVEELTTRLSSFVSKQLKDGNPNISDLSDKNRPTKLGEKFEQVYDNEWSDAFEYLKEILKDEDDVIRVLVEIIKKIHWFCGDVAEQQLVRLESYFMVPMTAIKWTHYRDQGDMVYEVSRNSEDESAFFQLPKCVKDYRKMCAAASVTALREMFKSSVYKEEFPRIEMKKPLEIYIDSCVEFIWLMIVQDPPMTLVWQEKGEKLDMSAFKHYRKKGNTVQQCVWPAVYLHKGGPVVSKGFILPQ